MSRQVDSFYQENESIKMIDRIRFFMIKIPYEVFISDRKGVKKMFKLFQKIPSISTNELVDKLEQSITLIDVRTPEEYRRGHIAKAVNYPLNKIDRYKGKENELYVICQSGMRSKQAAKVLKQKGYTVTNVQGGMNRWQGPIRGGK